ncbi:MAG: ABC transporter permease [Chloroflexi bacterium]|nr:MAG: ABC transporter permease [Chloroflexota bacterium]
MSIRAIAEPSQDERVLQESAFRKLLRRPELGAVGGAILVCVLFALVAQDRGFVSLRATANFLEVAAELGILSVMVALLMIGGEFDLSIGSIIGGAGMAMTILTTEYHWNIWPAIGVALVMALAVGAINGVLVVRPRLPSFIITLGSLFIIRGATIGLTRLITGRTQVGGIKQVAGYDSAESVFASALSIADPASKRGLSAEFPISIFWWLLIAAIATYVLLRTRPGNWIFGIGGDQNAARNMGVPVSRLKIILFMATAAAAWLVATIQVISTGGADTLRGEQREFYAIIAVVIGGTLLTGGYGSALGAVFGALTVGMVQQGIVYTGIDSDWFMVFLGAMLIMAVLVNNLIRKRVAEPK